MPRSRRNAPPPASAPASRNWLPHAPEHPLQAISAAGRVGGQLSRSLRAPAPAVGRDPVRRRRPPRRRTSRRSRDVRGPRSAGRRSAAVCRPKRCRIPPQHVVGGESETLHVFARIVQRRPTRIGASRWPLTRTTTVFSASTNAASRELFDRLIGFVQVGNRDGLGRRDREQGRQQRQHRAEAAEQLHKRCKISQPPPKPPREE